MSANAILSDVLKYCALADVEIIKLIASDNGLNIKTHDKDKVLFIDGATQPVNEFVGEFGIRNIKMLSGMLAIHNESDTLDVSTREIDGSLVMDQITFKGKGMKSVFKLMDNNHVPKQATIASFPWNIIIPDIDKSVVSNFQKFASLYSEIDKHFTVFTKEGKLCFGFGKEVSSSHSGYFEFYDTDVELGSELSFPVDKFISLMKLVDGNSILKFTDKGLMGVEITSPYGKYNYYLRQHVR